MSRTARCFLTIIAWALLTVHAAAVRERIAILGDSITYDGRWATLVESALRATPRFADAEIVDLGLASETVSGLSEDGHAGGSFPRPCLHERLERILTAYQPTRVLACYGMNDGIYQPLDGGRMKAFQDGILKLKSEVEKAGAKIVFITPPLYQADKSSDDPARYDTVLDAQAEWLLAPRSDGWQVIDIRPDLRQSIADMKRAKPDFIYAKDGIHPLDDGHRFIAESICKQLWPLWKLPGKPKFAEGPALAILSKRNGLLKHAWLTKTGHKRPGVPAGIPLDQAVTQAAELLKQYRAADTARVSAWMGYEKLDFSIDDRAALLVVPKTAAPGKPWIWRTEFFGHEPQGDIALLGKGFHVGYIDMQDLYGSPAAMAIMDKYFDQVTRERGLSSKVVVEGFSRGGLYAFNWAAHRPANVAGLYVDAPVCDFKSWPAGKGVGPGSPADWQRLLNVYQFTEAQALAYDKNPVDDLAPLAKAGIPILAIIGADDEVVPVGENIDLVEKRYQALGGRISVIRKPGGKHHPHSLPDPKPIVDFAVSAVSAVEPVPFYNPATAGGSGNFNTAWPGFKSQWNHRQMAFATTHDADKGAIVFFGDSITEKAPLAKLFPGQHVANRGISGDTSRGMVFRLEANVLDLNPSEVVLLCGVNDIVQPAASAEGTAANVKAICESIHARHPGIRVLVLKIMPTATAENSVVMSFNAAVDRAIAGMDFVVRVDTHAPYLKPDGSFDPAGFKDGTHPNEAGYEIYRKALAPFLKKAP